MAKKYDIDYALKKDPTTEPPHYYVFFKAKDKDQLQPAFKGVHRHDPGPGERPCIREQLAQPGAGQDPAPPAEKVKTKDREGGAMTDKLKKQLILNLPYLIFVYLFDKLCQGCGWRLGRTPRRSCSTSGRAFGGLCQPGTQLPSGGPVRGRRRHGADPAGGLLKGKNAKKYRRGSSTAAPDGAPRPTSPLYRPAIPE